MTEAAPRAARLPRRGARAPVGVVAAAIPVCALLALPVAYLAIRAAGAEASSWDLILRPRTVWLAARTAGLTLAVTTGAIALGVPMAWLTTRTDLPFRRAWAVLGALPLVIPSYVGAFTLLSFLGPRGLLRQILGVERLPDISGFPGALLALTLFTFPYVYLTTAAAIRGLDPALEDAARGLGHSRWTTFRRVTLPLLRPSIGAGALLAALYTLHDFGAVSLMRFPVFTQAIYLQYRAAFDRTPAAILSLFLVAMALVVVWLERRARGRALLYRTEAGTPRPPSRIALGRWRGPALAFCTLVVLTSLVLPVGVLVYWLVRGIQAGQEIGAPWRAMLSSMSASGGGAVLAVTAALPIAILAARHRGLAEAPARLAYAAFALPGIVVALAFVFFAANVTPALYQTLPLLVLAYVVLFLPQAGEPLRGSLLQINERIEEAGRSLGHGRFAVFRRLTLPLVARGALAGFGLVFLTAMKELPATLLLRPTGFETLATRVWTHASVAQYARAAAPALLLL
ncbi:MAG TPA: iron ABC transporter permease, partial [Actinomycetota bacterium]|nr:iron ABC transporter permease [Actinomycetota bacterium]